MFRSSGGVNFACHAGMKAPLNNKVKPKVITVQIRFPIFGDSDRDLAFEFFVQLIENQFIPCEHQTPFFVDHMLNLKPSWITGEGLVCFRKMFIGIALFGSSFCGTLDVMYGLSVYRLVLGVTINICYIWLSSAVNFNAGKLNRVDGANTCTPSDNENEFICDTTSACRLIVTDLALHGFEYLWVGNVLYFKS